MRTSLPVSAANRAQLCCDLAVNGECSFLRITFVGMICVQTVAADAVIIIIVVIRYILEMGLLNTYPLLLLPQGSTTCVNCLVSH